ncbi:MAG: DNA-processing protein DprA [Desulfovibrio sp.]|jgi:DNA processing protein|nr:DNA-processing protein DprA [Desulfovibrio sp.]
MDDMSGWAGMDEEARKEFWASLALRHSKWLGARSRARLLKKFGSSFQALQHKRSWVQAGLSQRQIKAVEDESWRTTAQEEWNRAQKLDCGILLWTSNFYPERLRELQDAPVFLYCLGDVSLLRSPVVAIVGSRHATRHGCDVAAYMSSRLAACGIAVVSGMAQGIDAAVHESALRQTGKSIGVLGTGIDKVYPGANEALFALMRKHGLLLSEFPPGASPLAAHFPIRNRIISGLALGVLVVEAASRSGSLITARLALEQNRDVFAVPGPALSAHCIGCQDLVRQGARAVFSAEDILRDLADQLRGYGVSAEVFGPEKPKSEDKHTAKGVRKKEALVPEAASPVNAPELSASRQLVECLRRNGDMQADALAVALNITAACLSTTLVSLELAGQIKRLPGARYRAL